MKLLLDANLSWRMVNVLELHFEECVHIDHVGLSIPAKDIEIWEFAKVNNFTTVTMDEDFIDFVNAKGFPPKMILLKTGNQSWMYLLNLLIQRKQEIEDFIMRSEYGCFRS